MLITLPTKQQWQEMDYFDELERQWKQSQINTAAVFPKEYKLWLKQQIAETENNHERLKTEQSKAYSKETWFYNYYILQVGLRLQYYYKELRKYSVHKDLSTGPQQNPHSITDSDIEAAKAIPIQIIYEGKLRRVGSRLVGICPFHNEKHGSFVIFPTNRWYCFGSCITGGDVIDFIMKCENLEFLEAVKYLL